MRKFTSRALPGVKFLALPQIRELYPPTRDPVEGGRYSNLLTSPGHNPDDDAPCLMLTDERSSSSAVRTIRSSARCAHEHGRYAHCAAGRRTPTAGSARSVATTSVTTSWSTREPAGTLGPVARLAKSRRRNRRPRPALSTLGPPLEAGKAFGGGHSWTAGAFGHYRVHSRP